MKLKTAADIIKHRQSLGMTQREYAELAGVSHTTIQRWEAGTRKVPHWIGVYMEHVLNTQ